MLMAAALSIDKGGKSEASAFGVTIRPLCLYNIA